MPSTYSPNKNYELMATGEDTDTWGNKTNANLSLIDKNLGSTLTKTLAGTNVTLTTAECENLGILLSGTLSANVTVTFPARGGYYVISNQTTGNFKVTLNVSGGGTGFVIAQGDVIPAQCDGTNLNPAVSVVPPGIVWDDTSYISPPDGFIYCYGQAISRTVFSALFLRIGTTFGAGDGSTTFNVPDYRGRVGFGRDNMGGTAANRITNALSGITGTTLGATGGAQSIILAQANLPSATTGTETALHNHSVSISTVTVTLGADVYVYAPSGPYGPSSSGITVGTESATHAHNLGGSGLGHNNMPPTLIVNKVIKV